MAAGKPQRQALAIAYATKRAAAKKHHSSSSSSAGESRIHKAPSNSSTQGGIKSHSSHSSQRSDHYHSKIIEPTQIRPTSTKMTRAEQQINNREEVEGPATYTKRMK